VTGDESELSGICPERTGSLVCMKDGFTSDIFRQMAKLHKTELSAGLLPLFGESFLNKMYRYAAAFSGTRLITILDGDLVVGFVMGSTGRGGFYRGLLTRTWPDILVTLVKRPGAIWRALKIASHVTAVPDRAELMSIVVRAEYRGHGVAHRLLDDLRHELGNLGVEYFFVIAATTQPAALRFYEKASGVMVEASTLGGLNTLTFRYKC
jgi:ribosomal protein S18 acetylase RimI-like enzyme